MVRVPEGMGRHVFGVVAIIYGLVSIAWHQQLQSIWHLPGAAAFVYVTSVGQLAGGIAIQFRKTAAPGALALSIVYLAFALTWVPGIVHQPHVYSSWGNVFERLAFVAGAVVVYGVASPSASAAKTICKAGAVLLGVCALSFMTEQAVLLGPTAGLVPKWLPPNGMFWAVVTTIAFGLAGVSIISGYKSLLASRLLTLMLLIFGVIVWIPIVIAVPSSHSYWGETLETFAIAGAAWVVADFLAQTVSVRANR